MPPSVHLLPFVDNCRFVTVVFTLVHEIDLGCKD